MNRYEQSETFKLLGKQYYNLIVEPENLKQIHEILDSYGSLVLDDPIMAGADIFVLGYIYGVRAERKKKQKARAIGK